MHTLALCASLPIYLSIEDLTGSSIQLLSTLHALLNMGQLMLGSVPTVEIHACTWYMVHVQCHNYNIYIPCIPPYMWAIRGVILSQTQYYTLQCSVHV